MAGRIKQAIRLILRELDSTANIPREVEVRRTIRPSQLVNIKLTNKTKIIIPRVRLP